MSRSFPWRIYAVVFFIILLIATAPLLSVMVSSWIAQANGCVLNEADAHVCMVWGMDIGGWLVIMFVMGWFMLATIPLGGGALVVWLVLILIHYFVWRQKKAQTP